MNDEEIRLIVREVVTEILELEPAELGDHTDFELVGADSLQRLEVIDTLRKRFGTRYTIEQESRMNSVHDVVEITQNSLAS